MNDIIYGDQFAPLTTYVPITYAYAIALVTCQSYKRGLLFLPQGLFSKDKPIKQPAKKAPSSKNIPKSLSLKENHRHSPATVKMFTNTPNGTLLVLAPQSHTVAQLNMATSKPAAADAPVDIDTQAANVEAPGKTKRSDSNPFIPAIGAKGFTFLRLGP
ncbi:hypothetical protein H104_01436 [Trichophyton rubrum CBS 289.86]|nr:hypothetical protein H104_01436 [Trichophyton rubrum CBS 289.86]